MHLPSDSDSCKNWFKYGKSFPENVKDALCNIPEVVGPTGPTGPAGPKGDVGGGVSEAATCLDVLRGINGATGPTYVNPEAWKCASDRYYARVWTQSITNQTYSPDALEYNIFDVSHSGSCVIAEPINMENGRTISVVLRQPQEGNATIIFSKKYEFDGGWGHVTMTSKAKDVVIMTKINDFYFCTMVNDLKPSTNESL